MKPCRVRSFTGQNSLTQLEEADPAAPVAGQVAIPSSPDAGGDKAWN